MEFKFNVAEILPSTIVEINQSLIPPGFSGDRRELCNTVTKVAEIVDSMGAASAQAQGLTKSITTADRLRKSDQTVYLLVDRNAKHGKGVVTGMLKTGKKSLYVFDRNGQHYHVTPSCILDFYVHESRQRTGLGKQLFEHMLQKENVEPVKLAIDRPSEKLLSFLNKYYKLDNALRQMNNYVVYDGFFSENQNGCLNGDTTSNSGSPLKSKESANGLQSFPSNYGRYGAPRPPCSMGQIIHNQSPVQSNEPTGTELNVTQSAPVVQSHLQNYSPVPPNVVQSAPNLWYQQSSQQLSPNQEQYYGQRLYLQQQPFISQIQPQQSQTYIQLPQQLQPQQPQPQYYAQQHCVQQQFVPQQTPCSPRYRDIIPTQPPQTPRDGNLNGMSPRAMQMYQNPVADGSATYFMDSYQNRQTLSGASVQYNVGQQYIPIQQQISTPSTNLMSQFPPHQHLPPGVQQNMPVVQAVPQQSMPALAHQQHMVPLVQQQQSVPIIQHPSPQYQQMARPPNTEQPMQMGKYGGHVQQQQPVVAQPAYQYYDSSAQAMQTQYKQYDDMAPATSIHQNVSHVPNATGDMPPLAKSPENYFQASNVSPSPTVPQSAQPTQMTNFQAGDYQQQLQPLSTPIQDQSGQMSTQIPQQQGQLSSGEPNNAFDEEVSQPSKLTRPRSLSIQLSEELENLDSHKRAGDVMGEVHFEASIKLPKDELNNIENDIEKIEISADLTERRPSHHENDENDDADSERNKSPNALTAQGFFDLKFYHSRLW